MQAKKSLWQIDLDTDHRYKLQHRPLVVHGVMVTGNVFKSEHAFQSRFPVRRIDVFHGIDPGDRVEMDTSIYISGIPVVLRSEHKESPLTFFDSWRSYRVRKRDSGGVGASVHIDISCNVTGINWGYTPRNDEADRHTEFCNIKDHGGQDTARPHWGFWFLP